MRSTTPRFIGFDSQRVHKAGRPLHATSCWSLAPGSIKARALGRTMNMPLSAKASPGIGAELWQRGGRAGDCRVKRGPWAGSRRRFRSLVAYSSLRARRAAVLERMRRSGSTETALSGLAISRRCRARSPWLPSNVLLRSGPEGATPPRSVAAHRLTRGRTPSVPSIRLAPKDIGRPLKHCARCG
jgi:hypothetical protein